MTVINKSITQFYAEQILSLSVERKNLVFSETYNTEFDKIIITFMDQNGTLLEIEDKANLTVLIKTTKKNKKQNNNNKKCVKGYGSLSFARNLSN